MASDAFLQSIFGSLRGPGAPTEGLVYRSWVDHLEREDKEQREYAQKLVDWYNRDTARIREHVKDAASPLFGDSRQRWLIPILNAIPRIIKRLSLAYIQEPERRLLQGTTTVDEDTDLWARVYGPDGIFRRFDANRKLKMVDNYSKLLNTVHIEVVPRGGAIDWDFHLRPGTTVIPDPGDYLAFAKLAYRYCTMDPETLKPTTGWVYWDKGMHAYRTDTGAWHGVSIPEGPGEGTNPYDGVVPIVTIRQVEQDDYWGRYGADLVEGVEQVHVQLANMWFNALMQSHGQPIGTNLGIPAGKTLVVGPDNPILVDGLMKEDVVPSLTFAKPESEVTRIREMIDWYIRELGMCYGLPGDSWSIEHHAQSGFAKFMDNIELLEDREDYRVMWYEVERDLFRKSVMVWNRWARDMGGKPLPDNLDIEVEFPPVRFPEQPTEKITRYTMAAKLGVSSPVRYFVDEEGVTVERATEKVAEIKAENDMMRGAPTFEQMFGEGEGGEE